jgi:flagellar hook-associated protein 3 FlgL
LIDGVVKNRKEVMKYSDEVSSGYRVREPGDTYQAGTISQFRQMLDRIDGFRSRVANLQSSLAFQDDVMTQVNDLLLRAKEVASQAANETNGPETRQQMAAEVWELREQLVQLANSTYQGKYIFGGADDDDPPYETTTAYTNPSSGVASLRYRFDGETGTSLTRTVKITDDLSVTANTPGNQLFDNALYGLERLGRALEGYQTLPATGAPNGSGVAFTFPADFSQQTDAITESLDLLDSAREDDIMPEKVSLGARMRRIETGLAILDLNKGTATAALVDLQDADIADSASQLQQAQTALEASMTVSLRILNISILDYL